MDYTVDCVWCDLQVVPQSVFCFCKLDFCNALVVCKHYSVVSRLISINSSKPR